MITVMKSLKVQTPRTTRPSIQTILQMKMELTLSISEVLLATLMVLALEIMKRQVDLCLMRLLEKKRKLRES